MTSRTPKIPRSYGKPSETWHEIFLSSLREELTRRKEKNPRYSLRQFARRLEVSPGNLSEFLAGKRLISREKALEVLDLVGFPPKNHRRLAALLGKPLPLEFSALHPHAAKRVPEWVEIAIAGLCELDLVKVDEAMLADRLGLGLVEITARVADLVDHGVLRRDAEGGLHHEPTNISLLGTFSPEERRALRRQSAMLALRSLEVMPEESACFRNMIFSGSADQMGLFREEVEKFLKAVHAIGGGNSRDEVFQVSLQLFPVRLSPP